MSSLPSAGETWIGPNGERGEVDSVGDYCVGVNCGSYYVSVRLDEFLLKWGKEGAMNIVRYTHAGECVEFLELRSSEQFYYWDGKTLYPSEEFNKLFTKQSFETMLCKAGFLTCASGAWIHHTKHIVLFPDNCLMTPRFSGYLTREETIEKLRAEGIFN